MIESDSTTRATAIYRCPFGSVRLVLIHHLPLLWVDAKMLRKNDKSSHILQFIEALKMKHTCQDDEQHVLK